MVVTGVNVLQMSPDRTDHRGLLADEQMARAMEH
jgi:hypothetical protein